MAIIPEGTAPRDENKCAWRPGKKWAGKRFSLYACKCNLTLNLPQVQLWFQLNKKENTGDGVQFR